MSKLEQAFWDFQDTDGNTVIIRGCPAASLPELEYLFGRLADELTAINKPFEYAYSNSNAVKSICHQILELNKIPTGNLSPQIINHLCASPGHLFLINFVASDEQTIESVEKVTHSQALDQLEAALVACKLVGSLGDAKRLTSQYSFTALQSILTQYIDMTDPESEGNKKREREKKEQQRQRMDDVLGKHLGV